ncbi:hypothetical protein [Thermomonospora cellulosilytica]|uniref:Uncharacterized protein n=1 Tax=Thermomonospora cellulosilytica TaxID=1411118 RepID=A0A7W3MTN7_9ACTN|nr:hypothetical protein [Thermomonospora cellulosilytica]MBA9001691.1 hypothetical protein [Thermomonospora cellulosilytica]
MTDDAFWEGLKLGGGLGLMAGFAGCLVTVLFLSALLDLLAHRRARRGGGTVPDRPDAVSDRLLAVHVPQYGTSTAVPRSRQGPSR